MMNYDGIQVQMEIRSLAHLPHTSHSAGQPEDSRETQSIGSGGHSLIKIAGSSRPLTIRDFHTGNLGRQSCPTILV